MTCQVQTLLPTLDPKFEAFLIRVYRFAIDPRQCFGRNQSSSIQGVERDASLGRTTSTSRCRRESFWETEATKADRLRIGTCRRVIRMYHNLLRGLTTS